MNPDNSLKNVVLKPYDYAFCWKKRLAFITTSLTAFVIISFIAALPIRDFKSFISIDVSTLGSSPESVIQQIIDEELADSKLSNHLAAASNDSGMIMNDNITGHNHASIRDGFNFQIARLANSNHYRLTAEYSGGGTMFEQSLTEQVVQGIGRRLNTSQADSGNFRGFEMQYSTAKENIERNSSARHAELIAANSMVDRLNERLSDIHNQVELFRPLPQVVENVPLLAGPDGQSNQVSSPMRVVNALLSEQSPLTASILKSLNELDTDNLQSKLGRIQQNLRNDAIQIREDVVALNSLAREMSENRIVVESISAVRTRPTNPLPGWGSVLLFALAATGVGAAITLYYRPELEGVGFETPNKISSGLGLPIVATFNSTVVDNESKERSHSVANSIIGSGQVVLFGFGLLVLLLCLLHSDVRTAFLENPFYGLAKLTGMFIGN